MKLSTRARYGLRMMIELARALKKKQIVHLGYIAQITGLSVNYLTQLAMPLKNNGLLVGISGRHGGYRLAKDANDIKVQEILEALQGPVSLTDCVNNPDICLNSSFCEARVLYAILSGEMSDILNKYSLADLIDKNRVDQIRTEYSHFDLLDPDKVLIKRGNNLDPGCPVTSEKIK